MPDIESPSAPEIMQYRQSQGKVHLLGSRCPSCSAAFFPSRTICPADGTEGLEELALADHGIIYTYTVIRQSTPEFEAPYAMVYIDFPQDVRVLLPYLGDGTPVIGAEAEIVLAPGPRLIDGALVLLPHAQSRQA